MRKVSVFQYLPALISLEFTEAGVRCALFNNSVIVFVADVISRHFSAIQGLSLKGNRLRSLDYISTLVYVAPKVV